MINLLIKLLFSICQLIVAVVFNKALTLFTGTRFV